MIQRKKKFARNSQKWKKKSGGASHHVATKGAYYEQESNTEVAKPICQHYYLNTRTCFN
jgi:hypothetical protein